MHDDYERSYNRETDTSHVEIVCWAMGDGIGTFSRKFEYEFPGNPPIEFRLSQPNTTNHPDLVPLTICAAYEDVVRIIVQVIDGNLQDRYLSKTLLDFPPGALGAKVVLENTTVADWLNADSGRQFYVAIGLGLTEIPYAHREWLSHSHGEDERDPAMQTHFGAVITPAHQPDWDVPYKVFEFPYAPHLTFTKPYGCPCLFADVGNPRNGWYSIPPDDFDDDETQADFLTNDDRWHSCYLIDTNDVFIVDRKRFGEQHPDSAQHYECYTAVSGHSEKTAVTEFAVLGWPIPDKGFDNILYNVRTKSDVWDETWLFEPEDGYYKIHYPYNPVGCYPVKNSDGNDNDGRLGFIMINEDGSASLLLQPKVYEFQECLWTLMPPTHKEKNSMFSNIAFLGIVPVQDGRDGYAFATDKSEIVVFDEKGELLHNREISVHFINDSTFYSSALSANKEVALRKLPANTNFPAIINLTSDYGGKLVNLKMNKLWFPAWHSLLKGVWAGLILLWLVGLFFTLRLMREKVFLSLEDHESLIEAEREETRYEREKHSVSAHEIRNPLNAIRGFAKLLKDDAPDDDQRESAEVIIKETDRLDGILKRLLDYSRELKLNLEDITLREWWGELKSIAEEIASEGSVRCSWSDPLDESATYDPELMQQVFINLFKNAVEASPEGEVVDSSLTMSKEYVVLRIKDNGPGITPEDAEKAFNKFHTTKVEGSGIGLPFSKRIVKAHGGEIYFDHDVKNGAAIVVKWPVRPPEHVLARAKEE